MINRISDLQEKEKSTVNPSVYLHKQGIHNSALVFHNYGNTVSAFVELSSPYMFLYGKVSQKTDQFVMAEITQSHNFSMSSSYSEFIAAETLSLHKHEFIEITYVLSGTLHMIIEGESYFIEENDCCICNKNIRHVELHDMDCEYFLIMLKEEFLKKLLENETDNMTEEQAAAFHPIFRSLIKTFSQKEDAPEGTKQFIKNKYNSNEKTASDHIIRLINSTLISLTAREPGWYFLTNYYLCRLLSCFENVNLYKSEVHSIKTSISEDLFIKISLMLEEYSGNLQRRELERRLGYNGDYLTRIIRRYTGMNFVEYAQSFSLKKAGQLLSETSMNIGNICLLLGYNNRTHFNKLFKKMYGLSPKEWRKKQTQAPP